MYLFLANSKLTILIASVENEYLNWWKIYYQSAEVKSCFQIQMEYTIADSPGRMWMQVFLNEEIQVLWEIWCQVHGLWDNVKFKGWIYII